MSGLPRRGGGRGRVANCLTRRAFLLQAASIVALAACSGSTVPGARTPVRTPPRVAQVGYVAAGTPGGANTTAFLQGLADGGWVEGQNLVMQFRWGSAGTEEEFALLVRELLDLKVDVIVTVALPAARAALQATATTPIVMASIGDPVRNQLVERMNRPGRNATGISIMSPQLSGKRLEYLKEALPSITRVAVLYNPSVADMDLNWTETQNVAPQLGVELVPLRIASLGDLDGAFGLAASEHAEALLVFSDDVIFPARARILERALAERLPTMGTQRPYAVAGALLAYGPQYPELFRRAAAQVDMILKGADPAVIPVEQPTRFELVANGKTAQALGITLPQAVRLDVTEVIE
ncbi:MAG TPA: ABC transporter substrate-binding protein [Chloroflexota bacterium]|jgi:putative ABC transport system substrate-binding protein